LSSEVSEVRAASIIRAMMEAARTSETSGNNYFTRQYIPEDKSELQTSSVLWALKIYRKETRDIVNKTNITDD
jgi:hypothetical protein